MAGWGPHKVLSTLVFCKHSGGYRFLRIVTEFMKYSRSYPFGGVGVKRSSQLFIKYLNKK